MDDVALRDAVIDDAPLLAHIGVQSWRETYAGLLSAPLLAGLDRSPFHDVSYWQGLLAQPRCHQRIWLVGGTEPIGLFHYGADEDGGGTVERLYLLRAAQRRGLGRRPMRLAADALAGDGLRPITGVDSRMQPPGAGVLRAPGRSTPAPSSRIRAGRCSRSASAGSDRNLWPRKPKHPVNAGG